VIRAAQDARARALAKADQQIAELKREREELLRELALAEAHIEAQQRQLIAAGVLDPELAP
jgi:hypothetical protein